MPRIRDAKQIDKLLFDNAHRFASPGWIFGNDTNLDKPELWETAKLRVLLQFLSPGETRAVSSTDISLLSIIKQTLGDNVFVDLCYLPTKHNSDIYDELNLPWSFGNVSHRPMHDYDVVFVSNAVVDEKYNLYPVFDKSGFLPYATQRARAPEKHPLIIAGGAASVNMEPWYGKSLDGKEESLVDMTYVGYAEAHLPAVLKTLADLKASGELPGNTRKCIEALYKHKCMYNPLAYKHHFADDKWTITKIEKLDPMAPDKVEYAHPTEEDLNKTAGFELKTLFSEGNYDSNDVQISVGCSGGHECSFCCEGNAQAWRQKSIAKIKQEMKAARDKSLASTFSAYSFNSNFHSYYEDMMEMAAKTYPKISAIAMRADEIAANPDFFKMDKYLGLSRITLGVEGVSDRIRNGYLNKSLSEEAILKAAKACFLNRFMQVKLFFILSGREEQRDWDEGIELLKKLIALRDSVGANTHLKVSFSILCYYPWTPIAWDERLSIKHVQTNARITYFIEKLMAIGLGIRFSSRGQSTVFQQLNLDVGRPMTAVFEEVYKDTGWIFYRNIPDSIVEATVKVIKKHGMPYDRMFDTRPYEWIFPCGVIEVKNEKFMIEASKRINRYEAAEYCMVTQARPQHRECGGCGICVGKKEIDSMVKRPVNQSKANVDDIIVSSSMNKPTNRYRFVYEAPKKYDFLNKRALAHYFMTKYFTSEEKDEIYGVASGSDPLRWNLHKDFQHPMYGQYIFDVTTRKPLDLKVRDIKDTLLRNTSVIEVPLKFDLSYEDQILTVLEVSPNARVIEGVRNIGFDKYPYIANDDPIEWELDPGTYPAPLLKRGSTSTSMLMLIPIRTNVVKYLTSVTNKTYYNVLRDVLIGAKNLMYIRPIPGAVCKVCGKDAGMNLATAKMLDVCPECLLKLAYKKIF